MSGIVIDDSAIFVDKITWKMTHSFPLASLAVPNGIKA
jgi:hypothetical protein